MFPEVLSLLGLAACIWVVVKDIGFLRRGRKERSLAYVSWDYDQKVFLFIVWVCAALIAVIVFGQAIALPLFVAAYLWRWGGYGPLAVGLYALATITILWGFYGEVLDVRWLRPVIQVF